MEFFRKFKGNPAHVCLSSELQLLKSDVFLLKLDGTPCTYAHAYRSPTNRHMCE